MNVFVSQHDRNLIPKRTSLVTSHLFILYVMNWNL